MAKITKEMLPEYTLEQAWEIANNLPLSFHDFANFTSLYGRMYGVLTGAEEGSRVPSGTSITNIYTGFVANACVVENVWRKLIEVSELTERRVNFSVRNEGYYSDDMPFPESQVDRTRLPGVTKLNVTRGWSDVIETVDVSPYFELDATVNVVGTTPIVDIPRGFADNPANVFLRKATDDGAYTIDEAVGYSRDSIDWKAPIDYNQQKWNEEDVVNLQHSKYVWVYVVEPTIPDGLPSDSVFVPIYKDTKQIIPHTWEQISPTERRYRLPIYSMVDPAFFSRTTNLINAEFYKLMEEIDFRYYYDDDAPLEVIYEVGNTTYVRTYDSLNPTDPYLTAELTEASHGLISYKHKNSSNQDFLPYDEIYNNLCNGDIDGDIQNIRIRIHYKCTPDSLPDKLSTQFSTLRNAIAWKVSAELPVESCHCKMTELGLIEQAQQVYADTFTNVFTGTTVSRFNYGDTHGQVVWSTTINSTRIYSRPIFANKRYTRTFR